MQETTILWADDEIDLLKPHILFLNEKGYKVTTATNGRDALEAFKAGYFDLVFLDENMPGLTGLETLSEIKNINSGLDLVVNVASTTAGAPIIQHSFGSSGDDQWAPVQNNDGTYTFYNLLSGQVLDDPNSSTTAGQQYDQWTANG